MTNFLVGLVGLQIEVTKRGAVLHTFHIWTKGWGLEFIMFTHDHSICVSEAVSFLYLSFRPPRVLCSCIMRQLTNPTLIACRPLSCAVFHVCQMWDNINPGILCLQKVNERTTGNHWGWKAHGGILFEVQHHVFCYPPVDCQNFVCAWPKKFRTGRICF